MKISIQRIALPPNNSMELTGQMRHVPCKEKSKGHAAFALQLMHGRYTALEPFADRKESGIIAA